MSTASGSSTQSCKNQDYAKPKSQPGAWVPWPRVEELCKLDLRPASVWQVFLAVFLTCSRYNGNPARLGVDELSRMTGLSLSTVKRNLAKLLGMGLLIRRGRYRQLQVPANCATASVGETTKLPPPRAKNTRERGVNMLTPRRGQYVDTSATCLDVLSLSKEVSSKASLTVRQQAVIDDIFVEATQLLGYDVKQLHLTSHYSSQLGLPENTTYGQALRQITSRTFARHYTAAVLALRKDPRVQGSELHGD